MISSQKTSQLEATTGGVKDAAMCGLRESDIEQLQEVDALSATRKLLTVQRSVIPLLPSAITLCWLSGTMLAMLLWAFFLTILRWAVKREYSGCVLTAWQEHSYSTKAYVRTKSSPSACPTCAGHTACKCNSLQTYYPELASQWDYTKNAGTPDKHTAHSGYMAWWTSPEGKSWQSSISSCAAGIDHGKRRAPARKGGLL